MQSANLLSYNLNYHAAYPELLGLTKKHSADILCLQECSVDELSEKLAGLSLAAKTTTGELGLAVYCDSDRYTIEYSTSVPMHLSTYEKLRPQERERLLIVELFDHLNQESLFVASFHATDLTATNGLRRKQFGQALKMLNTLHEGSPTVLAGDFNNPLWQGGLKKTANNHDYILHTTDKPTFSGRKVTGKFDMAATTNMNAHINALPFGLSDHSPILVRFNTAVNNARS